MGVGTDLNFGILFAGTGLRLGLTVPAAAGGGFSIEDVLDPLGGVGWREGTALLGIPVVLGIRSAIGAAGTG